MADKIEPEIKLYVQDLQPIIKQLERHGASCIKPRIYEHNIRYENDDQTLTQQGIVVRLRRDSAIRLTYKTPGTVEKGIISRPEMEVEVSDFDTMNNILQKLGYTPAMIYEKYRTTYHLNEAEIVLDEMPYGNFVEIEGTAESIETVINQIGLTEYPRFGYSYADLFEFVKHNLKLDFHDLTFDNFKGIRVPIDAFDIPQV